MRFPIYTFVACGLEEAELVDEVCLSLDLFPPREACFVELVEVEDTTLELLFKIAVLSSLFFC